MRILALFLCFYQLAASARAYEEVFATAGQSSSLQKRQVSARAAALGGNGASLEEGADSLMSNPAALAGIEGLEGGIHHQSWLADINQEAAVVAGKWGSQSWGLGLGWVDYGTIEAMDELGQGLGSVGAQDYRGTLGWASKIAGGLAVGVRGSLGQQVIAGESLGQSLLDIGLHWRQSNWRVGLVYANLASTALGGDRGPSAMRGEMSGDIGPLSVNAGFSAEPKGLSRLQAGLELAWGKALAARAGYEARLGSTLIEGFSGASFGLGAAVGPALLDYAFLPFGDLGAAHRISLKWRFDRAAPSHEPREAMTAVARPQATPPPMPVHVQEAPPLPVAEARPHPLALPEPENEAHTLRVTIVEENAERLKALDDALRLARVAEEADNREASLAILKGLLGRFPDNVRVWRALGDLQARWQHAPEAVAAYDRAFLLGLDDPALQTWLEKYRSKP